MRQAIPREMLEAVAREGGVDLEGDPRGRPQLARPPERRIPAGRRNNGLTSLAGGMRDKGFSETEMAAMLLAANEERCEPPLGEAEVRSIARSVARYDPKHPIDTGAFALVESTETLSAATPSLAAAGTNLPFRTAREIVEMSAERVPWVVEGYLAEGAITLIDGKPKASGKTTLVTHLCRKVLDGEPFMGLRTSATSVVYLSEQSTATFRESLARAGLQDRDDFAVLLWSDTVGANWNRVVREATEEAVRRGAKLLVVDTLPQFAGLQGDAENSAGAALAAIKPLQEAAAVHGLAIIVVRHERKSGGQVGDSGRGSSAFAGAVDVVASLRRVEGNSRPTLREIHALSRFDATPDVLVVELTERGYVSRGTRAAVAEAEAREAILDAASADASGAMSLDELLAETGMGRTTAQNAIGRLLEDGRLTCVGEGVRGDPRRYWRPGDAAAG